MAERKTPTWGMVFGISLVALYILSAHILLAFFIIIGGVFLASALERFHEFALTMVSVPVAWWLWLAGTGVGFFYYGLGLIRSMRYVNHYLTPPPRDAPIAAPKPMSEMVPGWHGGDGPDMPPKTAPSPEEVRRFGFGEPSPGGSGKGKR